LCCVVVGGVKEGLVECTIIKGSTLGHFDFESSIWSFLVVDCPPSIAAIFVFCSIVYRGKLVCSAASAGTMYNAVLL